MASGSRSIVLWGFEIDRGENRTDPVERTPAGAKTVKEMHMFHEGRAPAATRRVTARPPRRPPASHGCGRGYSARLNPHEPQSSPRSNGSLSARVVGRPSLRGQRDWCMVPQVVQKSCHRSRTCDSSWMKRDQCRYPQSKPEINKPAHNFENSGLRSKWHGVC